MGFDFERLARYVAAWHPCENGVHVNEPEGHEFGGRTVKNFPGVTIEKFRELSSCNASDYDLLVDEYRNGDLHDTHFIRRQDLALIERALGMEGIP